MSNLTKRFKEEFTPDWIEFKSKVKKAVEVVKYVAYGVASVVITALVVLGPNTRYLG